MGGDGLIARHRHRSVGQCVEHCGQVAASFCFVGRLPRALRMLEGRIASVGGVHRLAIAERSNDGRSLRKDQSSKQQDYCCRGHEVFE
jgi:hypothetical protein